MTTQISIVHTKDYDNIQDAIISAIKLLETDEPFDFSKYKSILLKPNLLIANKNACTQPVFVESVVQYLIEKGVPRDKIFIGDSPGQHEKSASYVAQEIGLFELCENLGIKFVDFEKEIPIKTEVKNALRLKNLFVAKSVADCDFLINLPRLKTHAEATVTGAIKNYWGIIPGGLKAKYHLLGKNEEEFGEVLTDNYSWVVNNKPNRLTIFDLQNIMEGSMGPVAGNMVNWNLILAGKDELALDLIALEIGKFKGLNYVPHLRIAYKRKFGIGNFNEIEILGLPLEDAKRITPKFNVPNDLLTKMFSYLTGNIGYKIFKKVPFLDKFKCKKCGQCAQICPSEAIKNIEGNFPIFLRNKCISCLCCLELCPYNAIKSRSRGLGGLFEF